jgi:hypothetical protein
MEHAKLNRVVKEIDHGEDAPQEISLGDGDKRSKSGFDRSTVG